MRRLPNLNQAPPNTYQDVRDLSTPQGAAMINDEIRRLSSKVATVIEPQQQSTQVSISRSSSTGLVA